HNVSHISSSGILLKKSVKAVIIPLKDGICSLTRVYEFLIDADVDLISGQCSNYRSIRQQIVQTQQSLEESEQAANTGLKGLDEHLERLTILEGKLEVEMRNTESTLGNLEIEQNTNVKLLNDSKHALDQSRHNLDLAEETLRIQEKRRRDAEIVTGVGAGLLIIPVVGWIAGAVMVTVGAVEMSQASDGIRVAKEELNKSESEVKIYKSKVSDYQSKISRLKRNIRQNHDEVEHIHKEIQQVKAQREGVAEFQRKVRRAVHLLSDLSGKTRVAECHTRRFILQKPVMKVMDEVMKAAGQITGNELLCTEGIPQLINTMRETHQRLSALCTSNSSCEYPFLVH
ncbi:hypothetical protein P4O66_019022, partial [Electrophorus voltai]